jgi:hypothetical protein
MDSKIDAWFVNSTILKADCIFIHTIRLENRALFLFPMSAANNTGKLMGSFYQN